MAQAGSYWYQDRVAGFFIDGQPMFPGYTIESVTWRGDQNVTAVLGMTPDHSGAGWVQGNFEGDIRVTVNVPVNGTATTVDPMTFDWVGSNATLQIFGSSALYGTQYNGDTLQFFGLAFKGYDTSGFAGVGRAGQYVLNFGARQMAKIA